MVIYCIEKGYGRQVVIIEHGPVQASFALQDWVFRRSHVTKTTTQVTSWPQNIFCVGVEVEYLTFVLP